MKGINSDRVREMLGEIADAHRKINELANLSQEEFFSDFRNSASVKYFLITAIEGAIDICSHISARGFGQAPDTYADCFQVLAEMNVIQLELAERLQDMARFRNLLVHHYAKIDEQRVYQIIRSELNDLYLYREQITKWILSE